MADAGEMAGMSQVPDAVKSQMDDSILVKMEGIISSMTKKSAKNLKSSKVLRKRRIAMGSGNTSAGCQPLIKTV